MQVAQPSTSDKQTLLDESTNSRDKMNRDESIQSLYFSSADLDSPMVEKLQNCTITEVTSGQKVDIAVQTDMRGSEIESRAVPCAERTRSHSEISSASGKDSNYCAGQKAVAELNEGTTVKSATPPRGLAPPSSSNNTTMKVKRNLQHRNSEASVLSYVSHASGASQASADTIASKTTAQQQQIKKFQKRRRKRSRTSEGKESGSSNDSIPEGAVFDLELGEDEVDNATASMVGISKLTSMGRSVSMPLSEVGMMNQFVDKQQLTEEWAKTQFASNLHPWSDADITPIMR